MQNVSLIHVHLEYYMERIDVNHTWVTDDVNISIDILEYMQILEGANVQF